MNVLIIFSHPWSFGGGETYVASLIKGLSKQGHKVILVTDKVNNPILLDNVVHYSLSFRSRNPIDYISICKSLKEILIRHKINIIHAQQRTAGYFAAYLKAKSGVPFVITLHDQWHRAPLKKMHRYVFKNYIAVSEQIHQQFATEFGINRQDIITIYNGIDEEKFLADDIRLRAQSLKEKLAITSGEKVITLVARVNQAKGHFDLVEALETISLKGLLFRCLIVGIGPDLVRLTQFVTSKGLEKKFSFLGYESDIPMVMAASDIVVLPSYREALGLSIIEAMFAQKPVIAYKVGGIPEVIEDNKTGLLVSPGDHSMLASTISNLLSNPQLCQSLGQNGYKKALTTFTLDSMATKTAKYYQHIINTM